MKAEPKARRTTPAKDVRGDSATFTEFMRKLIAVPHSEIKAQAEAEGERKPKLYDRSFSRAPGAASKIR
jgi:hypothetical protein